MGNIRLCILDGHLRYAEKLMDYLNRHQGEVPFETRIFSGKEPLFEYLKNNRTDIVLLGETQEKIEISKSEAKVRILLSEGKGEPETEGKQRILRYQSMEKIQKELISIYFHEVNENENFDKEKRKVKLITVYSPAGGCGVSSFSRSFAKIYRSRIPPEERILHICMDHFEDEESEGFSKLAYYLSQGRKNLSLCLQGMVRNVEGVDFLPASADFEELLEFDSEKMRRFFSECLECSGYSVIVMDLGILTSGTLYAMERSDSILIPQLVREVELRTEAGIGIKTEQKKIKQFRVQMKYRKKENVLEKIRQVNIPWMADFSENEETGYQKVVEPFIQELLKTS